jgi:hypothetical protein
MLDIAFIREFPDLVKAGAEKKRLHVDLDRLLEVDRQRRTLITEIERLRGERNRQSKAVSASPPDERESLLTATRAITEQLKQSEAALAPLEQEFERLMLQVPNVPAPDVPMGLTEADNVEIRRWGEPPTFSFPPRDHVELGEALDLIDIKRAVRIAGTRTYYLKNEAALLELAVLRFTLDHMLRKGFTPMLVPHLVKDEAMIGICFAITDYLGTRELPENQAMLAEAVAALESLRTVIRSAEQHPTFSPEGLALPDPVQVALARVIDLQTHARLVEIVRHICSASLIMAPGEGELNQPEIGPLLREFLAGSDARALERFKLLKLAWDYVCDSFGQRQLLFEEHASVNLARRRSLLLDAYDPEPAIRLAKQLAGIEQPAEVLA